MKKGIVLMLIAVLSLMAKAESITYRIVEYNASKGDYTLSACGDKPTGSYALFENDFGSTTGNRYNQIPRNKQATLWLEGWGGCTITKVTLWACSNIKSGQMALIVNAGDRNLYTMHAADFASEEWFGTWVSKDHSRYVELSRQMSTITPVATDEEVAITIKGGLSEGSVYVDAITIDYEPGMFGTESSMGYVFEKLEKKSTLNDGDVVMMYRSGDAAGDIDGMEKSHYLDAIGLASTSNVNEPFVETFTANKTTDGHWTLTNAYGDMLGASAAQHLAWNEGVTTWDITLGYDGATIASTNSKYGTMRYNAPSGSYPRFWNYTSTSLSLPYLYRRVKRVEPVLCSQIELAEDVRELTLGTQDTLLIKYTLSPANVTDRRLSWSSSDEAIAVVKSGIVFPRSAGEVVITATTLDGGATAQCRIIVSGNEDGLSTISADSNKSRNTLYDISGKRVHSVQKKGLYIKDGHKLLLETNN